MKYIPLIGFVLIILLTGCVEEPSPGPGTGSVAKESSVQAEDLDKFLSAKEDFVKLPETVASKPLQISEKELVLLADSDDFDAIAKTIPILQSAGFQVDLLSPADFDSKKESSVIMSVFSPESSTALQEIVLGIISDEEFALAKKSRQPFSLIKENVFADGQQVAVYLGRKKRDALRIFENSFNPEAELPEGFELPPQLIPDSNGLGLQDENSPNLAGKGSGPAYFAGLNTVSVPQVDDIFSYYQDNYQAIDEFCPSSIWDYANCATIAAGCNNTSGAYIFGSVTGPDGIHLLSDVEEIPGDATMVELHTPPELETTNLTKDSFPHCLTYDTPFSYQAKSVYTPYFWFVASIPVSMNVPRCISPPPAPNVVSYLYWNYLAEINYSTHYVFWMGANFPGLSRGNVLPSDGFFEHNSSVFVSIPNRIDYPYHKVFLQYYDLFKLKDNYDSAHMTDRENWNITRHNVNTNNVVKSTGISGNTSFFHTFTKPTYLYLTYDVYYKLTLLNHESWVGGSGDYESKGLVEDFLFKDDAWVENDSRVSVTAPSFNSNGEEFKEWHVNGQKVVFGMNSASVSGPDSRTLDIWVLSGSRTIEAKYEQNFGLEAIPDVTITQGETREIDISISSVTGVDGEVKLEVFKDSDSTLPFELQQETFSSIPQAGSVSTKLKLTAEYGRMPSRHYKFKVKVTGSGLSEEQSFSAEVVEKDWDLILSSNGSVKQLDSGQQAVFDIDLTSEKGFDLPVSLSVEGLPNGADYSFSENPALPNKDGTKTVQLTVTTSPSTPVGSYSLKVLGETDWFKWAWASEGNKATTALTLNVSSPIPEGGDFSLGLSPESVTVTEEYGTDLDFTLTITPTQEFNTQVYISVENMPPYAGMPTLKIGETYFQSSDPVTITGGSPVAITMGTHISASTPNGNYTFSVTVSGGERSHTKNGNIVVNV